jgi:hypothetical protein
MHARASLRDEFERRLAGDALAAAHALAEHKAEASKVWRWDGRQICI